MPPLLQMFKRYTVIEVCALRNISILLLVILLPWCIKVHSHQQDREIKRSQIWQNSTYFLSTTSQFANLDLLLSASLNLPMRTITPPCRCNESSSRFTLRWKSMSSGLTIFIFQLSLMFFIQEETLIMNGMRDLQSKMPRSINFTCAQSAPRIEAKNIILGIDKALHHQ